MLKQRVITAIILIVAMLGVLFFASPALFCLVMSVVTLGATWEWCTLMAVQRVTSRLLYGILMVLVLFNALFIPIVLVFFFALVWWLLAIVLIVLYPRGSEWWGRGVLWRGLMGIAVLFPCWAAVNYIRNQGIYALLFLFVLIWGADSAAYFVGRKWGRHKLAADVSPGKSIEGMIGALVFTVGVTMLMAWVMHWPASVLPGVMGVALLTVLFSIVGDLFESMLKRRVGVKDSGRLLPGHGGLLDRIDSLTAAAPIFALGVLLLGRYL